WEQFVGEISELQVELSGIGNVANKKQAKCLVCFHFVVILYGFVLVTLSLCSVCPCKYLFPVIPEDMVAIAVGTPPSPKSNNEVTDRVAMFPTFRTNCGCCTEPCLWFA
ncbi:unnamed protein product, partial [Laminaria digitata]